MDLMVRLTTRQEEKIPPRFIVQTNSTWPIHASRFGIPARIVLLPVCFSSKLSCFTLTRESSSAVVFISDLPPRFVPPRYSLVMVRLGNLLILSLNLVHARSQDGHPGAAILQRNTGDDSHSYTSNLKRLHHTVRHARSIIEDRDASIPVPESELHSIVAKIEDLENQVKALLKQGGDASSASAAAGSRPGPSANHDTSDQDCDIEDLSHDLGSRAVVDSDGQVSGHSSFRRNANCPMKSAGTGKKDGEAGVPSGESPGSGPNGSGSDGDSSGTGTESPEEPSSIGNSRVNPFSPATVVAADDTSAESSGSPEASDVMGEDTSSSMPSQKNLVQEDIPTKASATAAADMIPTQAVSDTREYIEIQTLPVNGKYITTTVTSTRTRLSTVVVAMKHSSTGVAQKAEMEDSKPTSPTAPVTETKKGPDSADTDEPDTVASPPSVGGFRKYTNSTTTVERVSNGTTENKIAGGNKDKNVAAAQAPSRKKKQAQYAVPDAKPSGPQQIQPNLAKSGSNASNVAQPEAVNGVHEKLMSLVATGARLESSNASRTAGDISETTAQPTAAERFANGTVADKFFNSTSQEPAPSSKPDQNREPEPISPQIKIVNVVPIRPKPSGGSSSAWTAPPTAKPGPSSSVAGPANMTSVRPLSGFKTIRTPQSRHSMNAERRDERS